MTPRQLRSVAAGVAALGIAALTWASTGRLGQDGILLLARAAASNAPAPTPFPASEARVAPEFPSLDPKAWAGPPTSLASLRGRVVLLNVWTFGCINCERTLPWIRSVASKCGKETFSIVGVHSPELDFERDPKAVEDARRRQHLDYSSFIDNGHAYWRAIENEAWPTVYLIDRAGRIRGVQVGEIHEGDRAARRIESLIDALLKEP